MSRIFSPLKPIKIKEAFLKKFFLPIDIASLVFFRISFGVILLFEMGIDFSPYWIEEYYLKPTFFFTYYGFEWVKPWSEMGLYIHVLILFVLAIFITIGFWYRLSCILFFLGFTYLFLLDQTRYVNHYYLLCLLIFIMIFIPAHKAFSVDVLRRPKTLSGTSPAWALWLLQFQFGVVYFYAGLAKINGDWLRGEPLRNWLLVGKDIPFLGDFITTEWGVYFFSYGGIFYDLLIVPLLLWKPTRLFGFGLTLFFHLINSLLWKDIAVFPFLMIAGTALFFPPDWPRLGAFRNTNQLKKEKPLVGPNPLKVRQKITIVLLSIYFCFQILIPLRHFLYPGNVSWTEEGHRFAWRMMLRSKEHMIQFRVRDLWEQKDGIFDLGQIVTNRQGLAMSIRPDMILQSAHFIAEILRTQGYPEIEVRVRSLASLNGREFQPLIDPNVNLASEPRNLWHASWIMPLTETLPK